MTEYQQEEQSYEHKDQSSGNTEGALERVKPTDQSTSGSGEPADGAAGPNTNKEALKADKSSEDSLESNTDEPLDSIKESAREDVSETQESLDAEVFEPPSESAGENAWAAFYRKLGAPADPDSYATPKDVSMENEVSVRRAAYKAGLSQRQYTSFVREAQTAVKEIQSEGNAILDHEMEGLKRRYGPRYPAMMQQYERGRQAFDLKTQTTFRNLQLTKHVGFVEGLAALGANLMEDSVHSGASFQGVNPYDRRTRNLTDQARLERDEPETARRLAAAAGVDLSTLPAAR